MNLKLICNKLVFPLLIAGLSQAIDAQPVSAQRSPDDIVLRHSGTLSTSDPQLSDGSHYDVYTFPGRAGGVVRMYVTSDDFDTYLLVLDPSGEVVAQNGDGATGSTNSSLELALGETGEYRIIVNSYDSTGRGEYFLFADVRVPQNPISSTTSADSSELILNGRCRAGQCSQIRYDGKTLLNDTQGEQLYAIDVAYRFTTDGFSPVGESRSETFGETKRSYVRCSRTRPAHIFQPPGSDRYHSSFLNPGESPAGVMYEAAILYWVTCHNIVGPNFFNDSMRQRAVNLGYPLNLRERQTSSETLEDLL